MSPLLVGLEDGHVGGSANDEEDEEDGTYWDVNTDCGQASEGSSLGWVGSMEGLLAHGDKSIGKSGKLSDDWQ